MVISEIHITANAVAKYNRSYVFINPSLSHKGLGCVTQIMEGETVFDFSPIGDTGIITPVFKSLSNISDRFAPEKKNIIIV